LSSESENSSFKDFINLGIQVISLNLSRSSYFLNGKKQLKKTILELNPDIIHTMGVRSDYSVSSLKIFRNIHVSTLHCFAREEYKYVYGKLVGSYLAKLQENAINEIKYPICCSFTLENKYKKIVNNDNLMTIQNGISFDKTLVLTKEKKRAMRVKLGLPLEEEIFLFVGRLTPHKNPELVISAFKKSNRPSAYLYILGDGILYDVVKKSVIDDNKIISLGRVNNVFDYLSCSDYFVSASMTEGLPLAVIEAGMLGLTLILSDIPQHQEMFDDTHLGVIFYSDFTTNTLSSIISSAKKINEMVISRYFIQRFTAEKMANNYMEIYTKI
jgi:glycosyltransferase involved in cell wall biosynthesis